MGYFIWKLPVKNLILFLLIKNSLVNIKSRSFQQNSFTSNIIMGFGFWVMGFGLPKWLSGKESTCQCRRRRRHGFDPWVRKIPWRRVWQPILVLLPRESHGQRSLAYCSPQGHTESDTTEVTKQQQQQSMFHCFKLYKIQVTATYFDLL